MRVDGDLLVGCSTAVLLFATLVGGITCYNVKEATLIAEAINNGAEPIDASCAITGSLRNVCIINETQSK